MMKNIKLWVRPEVLELGILPILSPDKLSIEMLSRFVHYCKDSGELGYPRISYDTWKYVAVKKMGLSVECAMVIFYSCLLFSQQQPDEIHNLEAEFAVDLTRKRKDEILGDVEVVTLELAILLYLHRLNSTHPRTQARQASFNTLTTDPWPSNVHLAASPKKQLLEEQYVNFIKDSLPEILSLLSGHLWKDDIEKNKNDKQSTRDLLCFMRSAGVLSPDVVKALSFIIGASSSSDRSEVDLLCLATHKDCSYQSGYLSKKKSFQKGLFEQWVLQGLDWAPHGEWLCVHRGRRLTWPVTYLGQQSYYKLITSPSPCSKRLIVLSELQEGMTVHMGDSKNMCDAKIRRCCKSNIYVLQPIRNAIIHKCHESRIVLGPVCGRIQISECRNTVVVCPARSLVINECRALTVHTLTPERPLLVGSRTEGVTLAPLNFHYTKLLQHLKVASLQTHFNLWNRPLHLGVESTITGSFTIMHPEDFHLLAMPFSDSISSSVDGRPPLLPPGLPHEFVKSVDDSRKNVSSLRAEIRETNLSADQRALLQKTIDARFKVWLKDTGKQLELDQLEKMKNLLNLERISKTTAI